MVVVVVVRCECDNLSEYGCRNSVILAEMWDVEGRRFSRREHLSYRDLGRIRLPGHTKDLRRGVVNMLTPLRGKRWGIADDGQL
jgi:hypothetical protein